ncbi:MAG: hypothetical protein MZW92_45835 [Comamonadaceae bacterium]|nr:hypothetical protein [Comamonadaceae bacterium]
MRSARWRSELGIVIVASLFERRAAGLYHNTAVVLERDGPIAGMLPQDAHPGRPGLLREVLLHARRSRLHADRHLASGGSGVLVCWDQWYPEAARADGAAPAPNCCSTRPPSAGTRATTRSNRRASATPGSRSSARMPSPTACRWSACNRVGFEPDPSAAGGGIRFWGIELRRRTAGRDPGRGRRRTEAACWSSTSTSAAPSRCGASGRSCATGASMPMRIC